MRVFVVMVLALQSCANTNNEHSSEHPRVSRPLNMSGSGTLEGTVDDMIRGMDRRRQMYTTNGYNDPNANEEQAKDVGYRNKYIGSAWKSVWQGAI